MTKLQAKLARLNAQLRITKGKKNQHKLIEKILKIEAAIEQLSQKRNTKKQKPVKKEIDFKNWDNLSYEEKAKYLYDGWKKTSDKLDKMNRRLISTGYQHMTRAKATTEESNRSRHSESIDKYRRGLAILLRERIENRLSVDKKYLDAVGSGIDYDQNGNYSPIAF